MTAPRKCIVCGKNPAAVPDRNRPGRPIKRVCLQCHARRLREDLDRCIAMEQERRRAEAEWLKRRESDNGQ